LWEADAPPAALQVRLFNIFHGEIALEGMKRIALEGMTGC
jgi:hypothetical protein